MADPLMPSMQSSGRLQLAPLEGGHTQRFAAGQVGQGGHWTQRERGHQRSATGSQLV